MSSFFAEIPPIRYEGPESRNPLAFRWYDKNRVVLGKRMEDHLRFAVAYWHTYCYAGMDQFGGDAFTRPWAKRADPMEGARIKAEEAFEFMSRLGAPFYCFHDRDVAPEGATPRESLERFKAIVELLAKNQERTGVRLLWGTANLFGHRRYMAGAATNPNPEMFAMAATQVKAALDATKQLGGTNYVLWGGREGYETILNTDISRELEQLGRFVQMVVEYKHKIGFKGTILIEPKPCEPTKHQYDSDVNALAAFLQRFGLMNEVKANLESNHALLAGHTFEHEIRTAVAYGILGSLDVNRGDPMLGWDTDQFPNSVAEMTLALLPIVKAGGLGNGGLNFDAHIRRQSIEPADLFHAHIGGMDTCARALLAVEKILSDGELESAVESRYAGWKGELGQSILTRKVGLEELSQRVLDANLDPQPVSGRQEYLENLLNRYV